MLGWQSQKTCNTWKINWKSIFFFFWVLKCKIRHTSISLLSKNFVKSTDFVQHAATIFGLRKDFLSIWRKFAFIRFFSGQMKIFFRQFDVIFILIYIAKQRGFRQFDEFLQLKNLSFFGMQVDFTEFFKNTTFLLKSSVITHFWTFFQLSVKILGRFLHKFWG